MEQAHIRTMDNGVQLPDLAVLLQRLKLGHEFVVLAAVMLPGDPDNTFLVTQDHAPGLTLERPYRVLAVNAATGGVVLGATHATLAEALEIFETQVRVVGMLSTMPEHMR